MRLSSLQIKGFKSFADRTILNLDHAVTGIVGPNGCGKSNIIDAIRWVIGEHKIKSLRSDSLEDLVFNGSKTRSPAGMAEVSLTFENTKNLLPTEFSTVTITRRFYKSGDSEYRLNDVACRLKDIHNLFLDTGVSNDSYAIIELGMVDDIIKDKDGSRRRMLEQAAGISLYKTRKKEATQKLEGTQSDISRIEDLLFEIASNLRTLESQARKAERYLLIKKEYREQSIELAKASLASYSDRYHNLQTQRKAEEDNKIQKEAAIAGDEAQIQQNKAKLVTQEQQLIQSQKTFNELQSRIRSLESDKKLTAQRLQHLQDRIKSINTFLTGAEAQRNTLGESQEQSLQLQAAATESIATLRATLGTLQAGMESEEAQRRAALKDLEANRQELQELQKQQYQFDKERAVANAQLSSLQHTQQQLSATLEHSAAQYDTLSSELNTATQQNFKATELLAQQQQQRTKLEKSSILTQENIEKLRIQQAAQHRALDSLTHQHKLLAQLVQSMEGYPASIKYLSQHPAWKNRARPLSEVLSVAPEYSAAIELALDPYLNALVVPNSSDAAAAIFLLQKEDKGRASLLICDAAPANEISPNPSQGILASSVIQTDATYQPLLKYLLRNMVIVPAQEPAAEMTHAVAADGSWVRREVWTTGGSASQLDGSRIGRQQRLDALASEIEMQQNNSAVLNVDLKAAQQQFADFQQEFKNIKINDTQAVLNKAQNQVAILENKVATLTQRSEQEQKQLAETEKQLADLQKDNTSEQETFAQLNTKLTGLQEQQAEAQKAYSVADQQFQNSQQQQSQQKIALARAESNLENQKQQHAYQQQRQAELANQIADSKQQLQEVNNQMSDTSGKLNLGDDELLELMEKRDTDERKLGELDSAYYSLRNSVSEHEKAISRQRREKEAAEQLLQELNNKISEMKLQVAGMKERLSVAFGVNLEQVLEEERTGDEPEEQLREQVEKLQRRLETIGEINPTAIEAYEEMKLRHDFIVAQKTDLEDARESLLQTISEVEQTANQKFRETFDQVRANFLTVFQALFTEDDTADLRLTDEENIAESGIEIYARPKGKRPSTLTQLSGGEKTLTSTAFLFAIYLIKPAPFCILDEVDAPLDDANVSKFTSMIRQFSNNSQFIIVTHNKQTMAAVDVVYGVTMQEPGVSKLVPVDFRSLN